MVSIVFLSFYSVMMLVLSPLVLPVLSPLVLPVLSLPIKLYIIICDYCKYHWLYAH